MRDECQVSVVTNRLKGISSSDAIVPAGGLHDRVALLKFSLLKLGAAEESA